MRRVWCLRDEASSVKGEMDSMGASRLALRARVDPVVSSAFIVVATCFNIAFIANESCQRRRSQISYSSISLLESSFLARPQSLLRMMIGFGPATACPNCYLIDLNFRSCLSRTIADHSCSKCAMLVANISTSLDTSPG